MGFEGGVPHQLTLRSDLANRGAHQEVCAGATGMSLPPQHPESSREDVKCSGSGPGALCRGRRELTGRRVAASRSPGQPGPPTRQPCSGGAVPAGPAGPAATGCPQRGPEGRDLEPAQGPVTGLASERDAALPRAEERCRTAPGSRSVGEDFLCLTAWSPPWPRAAWSHHLFIP